MLNKTVLQCKYYQLHSQKPRRFKKNLRTDTYFNHKDYVDTRYIDRKPVFLFVGESKNYQAAKWLVKVSPESLWRELLLCWILTYLGPPDIIQRDTGKNFIAKALKSNADLIRVEKKAISVDSSKLHESRRALSRTHTQINQDNPKRSPKIDTEAALQSAVKEVNDSVGPRRFVPTLLVYDVLPIL